MTPGVFRSRKALTVSIGLNVFLIFLIASHVWRYQHLPHQDKLERFLASVPTKLSTEDAKKFQESIEPERKALEAEEAALKQARERVVQALKAEQFDPQAFRRAVEDARIRRAAFENQFLKSFTEAAQRISVEGRRRISELRVNPG